VKTFYLRWGGILFLGALLGLLGWQRYDRDVKTSTPEEVLHQASAIPLRIQGRIEAGSLAIDPSTHAAVFNLTGTGEKLAIRYVGDDLDSLRELKVVVLSGKWSPSARRFESQKMALTPNYGYVVSAYLIGLVPMALFLFRMERKVALLYAFIKQEKLYQPENQHGIE
jgi:cytochrome c-type biogenesis protein CcmE